MEKLCWQRSEMKNSKTKNIENSRQSRVFMKNVFDLEEKKIPNKQINLKSFSLTSSRRRLRRLSSDFINNFCTIVVLMFCEKLNFRCRSRSSHHHDEMKLK